jgi:ssDNA-binding Zn-finger/Zn-ribbon topoisomerase 1
MAVVQAPFVRVQLDTCPSCGKPAKFKAAGVSRKTGNSYSAFYACAGQPECKTFYKGAEKTITWTVDRDWTAAYNRAHGVGV